MSHTDAVKAAMADLAAAEAETGFQLQGVTLGTNFDDASPAQAQAMLPKTAHEIAGSMRRIKEEMDAGTLEVVEFDD